MSLRDQPASERAFASLVVLALASAMALGATFVATRELAPGPAAAQAGPPQHSRLLSVLDGVMAVNTNPAQVEVFRTWVKGGATREGWPPVESIVTNNCSRCHDAGGQFPRLASYEDLRPIALEETPQGLMGLLRSRPLHLFGFPAILLLSSLLYLRRTAWSGRKALMAATAAAVVFDLAQWMLRQGAPAGRWAAWTALAGLAAAMLAQVGVVLAELWRPRKA
ncbi:hypothetical protein GETHPA_26110 [Geothrix rubra]|uniref:Elongation factor-1 alpha n=1 Tax=Geothrix rubra TaxID=2927977 RepID=A0ABQ5Q8S3_9BACT|nr:hypothetical protein [Geothrix rubra]GLH71078.1 hypothetical protein GETHPA_26110 [Geothrix rubra]